MASGPRRTLSTPADVTEQRVSPPQIQIANHVDVIATLAAVGLIAAAAVVGLVLNWTGHDTTSGLPPLSAFFDARIGPGTAPALLLAGLAVFAAPRLALRLRWGNLLLAAGGASFLWTVSLALVDGWQKGWAGRLETPDEYLANLPRIGNVGDFLAGFSSHIVDFEPGSWTTHVSAHPPLATLVFWALDRIGLAGGGWAGLLVMMSGASTSVAIAVTFRALGAERIARRMLPALVFFPGAVWVGVSADGMFAAVAAWSVALAAIALRARRSRSLFLAAGSGLLLGATVYLSYGLVLVALLVGAVFLTEFWSARTVRWPVLMAVAVGFSAVVVAFTAGGFDWFTGLSELRIRYYQGIASQRSYAYYVWANIASLAIATGPAAAAGVVRAARTTFARLPIGRRRSVVPVSFGPALLVMAATLGVVIADLTGLSKAETERIWLPFAVWLVAGTGLLPARSRRWVVLTQVVIALLLNHLLGENW